MGFRMTSNTRLIYIDRKQRHTMHENIRDIPLNEIVKDLRVQDYVRKRAIELAKINISKFRNNQSQLLSCHSWLLCLHYRAITLLQGKYSISKPEFMVLMGAFLLYRLGHNPFRATQLSDNLLSWQHNRVYRHLYKLSEKGYIKFDKNPYSGVQRYSATLEGKRVIRAFNQHYQQVFGEVWDKVGDLPRSFDTGSFLLR